MFVADGKPLPPPFRESGTVFVGQTKPVPELREHGPLLSATKPAAQAPARSTIALFTYIGRRPRDIMRAADPEWQGLLGMLLSSRYLCPVTVPESSCQILWKSLPAVV